MVRAIVPWRSRSAASGARAIIYDTAGRVVSLRDANGGTTAFTYDTAGRLASLTDPAGNTTSWLYDAAGRLVQETDPLGASRFYVYNAQGELARYTDRNGRVRQYAYDAQGRVVAESWYASAAEADSGQPGTNTIHYAYDDSGRITAEWDGLSSVAYVYGAMDQILSTTTTTAGCPTVTLDYQYDSAGRRTRMAATIDGTADFVDEYGYDWQGRLVSIVEHGAPGGHAVAEKRITLSYNLAGQLVGIDRYLDGQLAVEADYSYDAAGRLAGISYHQGTKGLGRYGWTYSDAGPPLYSKQHSGTLSTSLWRPTGGLPVQYTGQGMLPVHDTAGIVAALVAGGLQSLDLLTSATSTDGKAVYSYDPTGQLVGASYTNNVLPDEVYAYDANGNRLTANGSSYVTGPGNRLLSDGTYCYQYDAEGNRTAKFIDVNADGVLNSGDTSITVYGWDVRNRLVSVTSYDSYGDPPSQAVEYRYDAENRWVGRTVDDDGDGHIDHRTAFVYDGTQIVLHFEKDTVGNGLHGTANAITVQDLSHRYLWGAAVDQLLADEQLLAIQNGGSDGGNGRGSNSHGRGYDLSQPGRTIWPLADHLGTVRDLAVTDPANGQTTIANHRTFDAYGNLLSQTNAAVDCLFAFTGRPYDPATALQNNLHRWYDPAVGRWLSEDPSGLKADGTNLYRHVGNSVTNVTDPRGLTPWKGIAEILGKKWTVGTCERAARVLATELLQRLGSLRPTDPKAQEIIKRLKAMGWVETTLRQGDHAGQGMILWEVENGRKTGRMLQWHPGGGHHGPDPYWKFSTGEAGTLRYLGGKVTAIAIAAIPGVAQAQQGDWNGAARDVAIELSPLTWVKMGVQALGSFFDSCERHLYGEDYHREMERYRNDYWERRNEND